MLNKSFGVIYFHFNIFSEKTANKLLLKIAFFEIEEFVPNLSISHYFWFLWKMLYRSKQCRYTL